MQHLKIFVLLFSALLVTASPIAQVADCDSTDGSVAEPTIPVYTSYSWTPETTAPAPEPAPTGEPGSGYGSDGDSTGSPTGSGSGTGECTAGAAMCCQSVTTPGKATAQLGGLLDGLLDNVGGVLVGIHCSALPILGSEW